MIMFHKFLPEYWWTEYLGTDSTNEYALIYKDVVVASLLRSRKSVFVKGFFLEGPERYSSYKLNVINTDHPATRQLIKRVFTTANSAYTTAVMEGKRDALETTAERAKVCKQAMISAKKSKDNLVSELLKPLLLKTPHKTASKQSIFSQFWIKIRGIQ